MSKRKFEAISSSGLSPKLSSSQKRQQQRLEGYLENAQTQLLGALKLVRGFERQKLSRRRKDAREKNAGGGKEVVRIDHEIAALNKLNFQAAAEFYIARTLCRIKTIARSTILPEELKTKGTGRSPYQDPADANVTARLFKSVAVMNAMNSIEDNVRDILEISKNNKAVMGEKRPQSLPSKPSKVVETHKEETDDIERTSDTDDFASSDDAESIASAVGSRNDEEGFVEDDMADYDERLASESEDDSDQSISLHRHSMSITPDREDVDGVGISSRSISVSPPPTNKRNPTETLHDDQQNQNGHTPAGATKESKLKPPKKTAFLPTLAAGYISGSEDGSYGSDDDKAKKPKKRNRMGQQARRALAEQQYGAKAKHLQGSNGKRGKSKGSNAGWDAKRGAIDSHGRGPGGRGGMQFRAKPDHPPSDPAQKPKKRQKDDTGALHPSWIAKKKLKEQQTSGVDSFAGKKVVFD